MNIISFNEFLQFISQDGNHFMGFIIILCIITGFIIKMWYIMWEGIIEYQKYKFKKYKKLIDNTNEFIKY